MKKLLGYVLIHPEKEDFVCGLKSDEMMQFVFYGSHPSMAKVFKDFDEIKDFLSYIEDFDFDIARLFDTDTQYFVDFETTVSSSPISRR